MPSFYYFPVFFFKIKFKFLIFYYFVSVIIPTYFHQSSKFIQSVYLFIIYYFMNHFGINFTPSFFNYYLSPYSYQYLNPQQPLNNFIYTNPSEPQNQEQLRPLNQQVDVKQQIDENARRTTNYSTNKPIQKQKTSRILKTTKSTRAKKEDSEYEPEISYIENPNDMLYKQKYLKKNTESNICNQAFSYLTMKPKSVRYIQKILQMLSINNKQTIDSFYEYIIILKDYKRKYVNKKFLLLVASVLQNKQICSRIQALGKISSLSIKLFAKIVRILLFNYLNQVSTVTILTSKKIQKITLSDHFNRRRKISKYLLTQLKKQQK